MLRSLIFLCALLSTALTLSAQPIAHTVFSAKAYKTGETSALLAITLIPEPHWHTYWINPGDSGMTLSVTLENDAIQVGEALFPLPHRYEQSGGLVAYGYEAPATIYFPLSGRLTETLAGEANWLACDKDSCVLGEKAFSIPLLTTQEKVPSLSGTYPTNLTLDTPVQVEKVAPSKWRISFTSEEDYRGYGVFPYDGNFSEINGKENVQMTAPKQYFFTVKLIGPFPDLTRFLLSNGEKGVTLTL